VPKYDTYVTLYEQYEAENMGEAFDKMMEDIKHREGMSIVKHRITPPDEDSGDE